MCRAGGRELRDGAAAGRADRRPDWGTLSEADRTELGLTWTRWDVLASAAVLTMIGGAYLYFVG